MRSVSGWFLCWSCPWFKSSFAPSHWLFWLPANTQLPLYQLIYLDHSSARLGLALLKEWWAGHFSEFWWALVKVGCNLSRSPPSTPMLRELLKRSQLAWIIKMMLFLATVLGLFSQFQILRSCLKARRTWVLMWRLFLRNQRFAKVLRPIVCAFVTRFRMNSWWMSRLVSYFFLCLFWIIL